MEKNIMEDNKFRWTDDRQYQNSRHIMSPEIVEIDDSKSFVSSNRDGGNNVYIAVGKDDMDVLRWSLNHAVLPGACVFLIHVYPPANFIPTPVGKMPRSQANQEQISTFLREENTRRRNLLQKYVNLCNNFKVTVETMLIESNHTAKAIVELIPVLNINMLVMGTKKPPRKLKMGQGTGQFVQKNAPDICEVAIVFNGKRVTEKQQEVEISREQSGPGPGLTRTAERNFLDCGCFSGKNI